LAGSEANYAASAASGSQKMASWLTRMLQETGFESESQTGTSIAHTELPNATAAVTEAATPVAVAEFTPAPVHDRRRRRRRRDEQGTRRRDRDRRRQEEDDAALARRLAAEDAQAPPPTEDAQTEPVVERDRDTVACRACGQRLAASVDAIEAHSLHCAAEASEAWAHAAARCREVPDGLVGAAVEVRGRGKGVVAAVVRKPGSKLAIKLAKDAPPSWAQPRFDVRFATGTQQLDLARTQFRFLDPTEAEALSSARADRLERELEEARNEAARHARQAARAEAALARARRDDDDARLCAVCLDAPKDAALVPCGHRTCRGCAKALRRRKLPCPSCRQPIEGTIKVY
jgi:hypothetical protein